jgi:hypothetical protein
MERVGLLAIGVNSTPAAKIVLGFAERDAHRVTRLLTSSRGRVRKNDAHLRLGAAATARGVSACLSDLARSGPDHLILYVSGHGGWQGIGLADGVLSYPQLRAWLNAVGARTTTIILDVCHAGSGRVLMDAGDPRVAGGGGLGGLEASWNVLLKAAFPGMRILAAVDENENTYQDPIVESGRFTFSLLRALQWARGDIMHGGYRWISDVRALQSAKLILAKRWPYAAAPLYIGPPEHLSALPLLLSQADHLVGRASLRFAQGWVPGAAVQVELDTFGRRHLPTRVTWSVSDEYGQVAEGRTVVVPDGDSVRLDRRLVVDPATARNAWGASVNAGWRIPLTWDVRVEDELGQVLDEATYSVVYQRSP